ncbi:MAG: RluA family pseudouridine synthase [Myxococcales bacterium]|nr:RluA family pseudouridine synthase [Myxococcales bacterium]
MSRRPPPRDRNTAPALGALVREQTGESWKTVKRLVSTGKVFVDGRAELDAGVRPPVGASIEIRNNAKKPKRGKFEVQIVYQDAHLVVIDKPSGVSSVPYSPEERDTAMDLVRAAWRTRREEANGPLIVVHRIDKDTSGLLMFARSKKGELGLARQLRDHTMDRQYSCVCNGRVSPRRIESFLIRDRGDGLRGTNRHDEKGRRSVTHVEVERSLRNATLCRVRLETGRTHQIRIHLSEAGHVLVGERVYSRDAELCGRPLLSSPRLLLHAQTLGFVHPVTGERLSFRSEYPADFTRELGKLEVR